MKKLAFLFFLPFLISCSLRSDSNLFKNEEVLARFDGAQITDKDFMAKVEALPKAYRSVALSRKKELIEDIAAEHFLMKEAERQGLSKDPEVQDVIRAAQKKIIIAKLIEKEIDSKLTVKASDAEQYYESHKDEFMTPLLLRASHILVKTQAEAQAIKSSLDQGADFEETARQRSLDSTAARGGDLGFFQKGQFVPEFEQTVFDMKKGEIRGPVQTQFGYHLLKLYDRVEPRLRDFQSVKSLVEERLVNERRAKAFKEYVEKLRGNIKIDINEQALEKVGAISS